MNRTNSPPSNGRGHEPDQAHWTDPEANARVIRAAAARQASPRRRLVDPTACARDNSAADVEFRTAIQNYKQQSGRMFPTWSEVLEVLRALGYEKTLPH
jgi:hypothetical protein